jgi:hypothetical protein
VEGGTGALGGGWVGAVSVGGNCGGAAGATAGGVGGIDPGGTASVISIVCTAGSQPRGRVTTTVLCIGTRPGYCAVTVQVPSSSSVW